MSTPKYTEQEIREAMHYILLIATNGLLKDADKNARFNRIAEIATEMLLKKELQNEYKPT